MATLKLMNSTMMPQEGFYRCEKISPEEARNLFQQFQGKVESYIGYPDTAQYMEQVLRATVPLSRATTTFEKGDKALVCKLAYRLTDPNNKGKNCPKEQDYEWYVITYYGDREQDLLSELDSMVNIRIYGR
jgi:hypothetical protein